MSNSHRRKISPVPPTRRTVTVEAGYPEAWRIDLHNVTVRIRKLREKQGQIVAQAIAAGATWSAIANVLGTTRQNAWQRFKHLEPVVSTGDRA